jgi:hypothetical protein
MLQSLKRNIFFLRPIRSIKKIVLWFCLLFVTTLTVVDGCAKLPDGDGTKAVTGSTETLRHVVYKWINSNTRQEVVNLYGPIEDWDTSDITNMNNVFWGANGVGANAFKHYFNADISKWNMGAVTTMGNSKYLLNSTQKNIYTLRLIQLTVFLFHAVAFLCSIYSCKRIQR